MAIRLIKRYSNRKLYDQTLHRWVRLSDIARMVADGDEVRVVDHSSGEDITERILADALSHELRSGRSPMRLIKKILSYAGHGFIGFFKLGSHHADTDEAILLQDMFQKFPAMEDELNRKIHEVVKGYIDELGNILSEDELRQMVRNAVCEAISECVNELKSIREEIAELRARLEDLSLGGRGL